MLLFEMRTKDQLLTGRGRMKKQKILLIGGAGFIGFNLAVKLRQLGHDVLVIDSLQVNNLLSLQDTRNYSINFDLSQQIILNRLAQLKNNGINLLLEDARDYLKLNLAIQDFNPNVIYHLAAVAHATKSNKDPYSTFDHSFRTLENALDIARTLGDCHFIFFSSSMVYGDFEDVSPDENSKCEPKGIYGAIKLGGEKLVIAYNQVFGLKYTIVRPSALYGPGCISRRVIQTFIENALSKNTLIVKGDGSEKLDFTYIEDLIQGLNNIIESPNSFNQIFNITTGNARSVSDVIDVLKEIVPDIEVEFIDKDSLNPERGTLNISKAESLLQYRPKFSLESGITNYVKWYEKLFSTYNINLRKSGERLIND